MPSPGRETTEPVNTRVLFAKITGMFVFFCLALFLPAGTLAWPAGWVFLILFFGFSIGLTIWLLHYDPGLLIERQTGFTPDQETWDKILIIAAAVTFFAWLMVMPMDSVRFHWTQMPVWLQAVGAMILTGSFLLFYATFRENHYLSPVVRVQHDRGQTVVSTGPYHFVRHPMYSAFVLLVFGTALMLGSKWGLIVGLAPVAIVAGRAVGEERTLRAQLQGYDAYMTRVRYRLVPYLW